MCVCVCVCVDVHRCTQWLLQAYMYMHTAYMYLCAYKCMHVHSYKMCMQESPEWLPLLILLEYHAKTHDIPQSDIAGETNGDAHTARPVSSTTL